MLSGIQERMGALHRRERFRTIQLSLSTWGPGWRIYNSGRYNGGLTAAMSHIETSRLPLRSDLAELARLASWIEHWAEQRVPPNTIFALQLCIEEAVANIIMHGTASEDRSEIAVELEYDGETLRARVEDSCQRFDPTGFPPPIPATSLEKAKVGNLGIHLMRSFANGMHYERRDRRNRSTFWFGG